MKFSRNGELLCGNWLLKSFEQREGQRILPHFRNRVEIEAQKASFELTPNEMPVDIHE